MSISIPLPEIGSLPSGIREAVEAIPLNIFRMAANAPASFMALAAFARSILFESQFDPRNVKSQSCGSHGSLRRTMSGPIMSP